MRGWVPGHGSQKASRPASGVEHGQETEVLATVGISNHMKPSLSSIQRRWRFLRKYFKKI